MSGTLKSRTARSALFLLRENLKDLRTYSWQFDPAEIDRVSKAAELVSTSLKKLQGWVAEEPANANDRTAEPASDEIDVLAIRSFLNAVESERLCPICGGMLPPS
ncbi:MAG: hypothetical protein CSA68_09290 [Rhodobacterales bacterium]|nr:MAG: hypothetical protein CSA68_09290 [Rhodobacterales bacterium]